MEPRVAAVRRASNEGAREAREAEREVNDILRERERLIQTNENAQERYTRRLETLGRLVERSDRIGQPIPDETVIREANAAIEELERGQERVQEATTRASDTARELGLTFSSAFEDAIVKGESFSKVLKGIVTDLARIVVRRTITEPLGAAVTSSLGGFDFGSIFSGIGSALGGIFRADGGPVSGGQPYIVGERGPEWFVPDSSGTVLPNGMSPGGGQVINNTITIDARGADAGVESRLRIVAGQIARQASAMTLDSIRRGGSAASIVRG